MRAVLSDFDGVLVDSTPAVLRAWAEWGERHGLDGRGIVEANHGRPAAAVVAEVLGPDADVAAEAERLEDIEVADTEGVVALPGAAEVLALPVVAIVTSCTLRLARARLAASGLPEPAVLVCADMVAHGKPAPDPYLLGAERLGVEPADCVVLEDAPAGIAAGRAAGMAVWAVATTHEPADLDGADRIASGVAELLPYLGSSSSDIRYVP